MGRDKFDAEAWAALAAPALGLTIDPAWKPAVVANLARLAEVAGLVMEFPLADEDEAGPVFTP